MASSSSSIHEAMRVEHDLIGYLEVPVARYYGVHTQRALENFAITGVPISIYPEMIISLACIKQAAAITNAELGNLDDEKAAAIIKACEEIRSGKWHSEFVVDVIQGGAGTSTNMNANEVIANRALELMGKNRGEYQFIHPNNDVNMSQSTNDVYPTAIRIALRLLIDRLAVAMTELRDSYGRKASEFKTILKMGRTQLQDAVPMTLGQEFSTYQVMMQEDIDRLKEAANLVLEINMGATAIGTGINSEPTYAPLVTKHLAAVSGVPVILAGNLIEATQDCGAFVQLSGVLKRIAVKTSKVCNDLRLLSSGPRAGFGELTLPPMQAGSSIMPGKVNPVIPEVMNQVAFEVIGNDASITMAAEAGQLQLNAFEPIIAHSLFKSLIHLRTGMTTLARRCVDGIKANTDRLHEIMRATLGTITALAPILGYETSTSLALEAQSNGRGVYEMILEKKLLTKEELEEALKPEHLTTPHLSRKRKTADSTMESPASSQPSTPSSSSAAGRQIA